MSKALRSQRVIQWRKQHMVAYDSITMFVYMLLAYAWSLGVYPLGRDYANMSGAGEIDGVAGGFFVQRWHCSARRYRCITW